VELAERGAILLHHQIAILRRELADWRSRTQQGPPLEKHHSQVVRIAEQIAGFLDETEGQAPGAPSFAENKRLRSRVLGAHRIWDYFRSKLGLRNVPWLQADLLCADEFAWECYRPAREQAGAAGVIAPEALKEPPLIFFSGDASPYARSRNTPLLPEGITEREVQDFGEAILALPIPVVGVPWFQVHHLPSAVVIGHEVGHAVEHDFGLDSEIEQIVAALAIPEARRKAWSCWRHELFADAYGVLSGGLAAVIALQDYLSADVAAVQTMRLSDPDWGRYPTTYLRMRVNFELLRQIGLPDGGLQQIWADTYGFDLMHAFEADVPSVVEQLLTTPLVAFGGRALREVIVFAPEDQRVAEGLAYDLNQGIPLPQGVPFRRIFAAATLAYHTDPRQFALVQDSAAESLTAQAAATIAPGVRSAEEGLDADARAELAAADRMAGRSLLRLFS